MEGEENIRKEGKQEAEGKPEAKEQQEAEREGEREGEEQTGEETEPHSGTRGKDCAVHDGESKSMEEIGKWGMNREIGTKSEESRMLWRNE
jgi:hypothetical protein